MHYLKKATNNVYDMTFLSNHQIVAVYTIYHIE